MHLYFIFIRGYRDLFPFFAQLCANVPIIKDILEHPLIAKVLSTFLTIL